MCTNDKKLLHYKLNLKLNESVMPIELDPDSPEAIAKREQIAQEEEKARIEKEKIDAEYKSNEKNVKAWWEEQNPGEEFPGVAEVAEMMKE